MENTKSRTYGPLSTTHIELLKSQLDKVSSQYRIFKDDELLRRAQVRSKGSIEGSPLLHNSPQVILKEFLFIEIPLQDILVVRQLLLQLGYEQTIDVLTAESLDDEEFICPKCDHLQTQMGYCPQHHLKLIPYFERWKLKETSRERWLKWLICFSVLIFVSLYIYSEFFSSGLHSPLQLFPRWQLFHFR